ncbi:MAG: ABC transporter substrate-binding protein, partial [Candidatus Heimdallarchaeota archaeon]
AGYETILRVRSDSWWVKPITTNDPDLNWKQRFGDFSGGFEQLRVRIIPDLESSLYAFENGNIDLNGLYNFRAKREQFILDPNFEVQSDIMYIISFFGYNMRETRFPMGLRDPSPLEPSITIGLAVRKAISYAINRDEMNDIVHGGEYSISDWPIFSTMGIWCNPNIIKYDFDLEKAREYMTKAGFDTCPPLTSPGLTFGITFATIISVATIVIIISRRKKKIMK